jgi:AraC family transcriptional regulator of adaptative response / DNA-3-methyladenine glycosylase II
VNVTLPAALAPVVGPVLARVRHLLDLGANPHGIDAQLGALAAECPGMRVPGAFDGFEIIVRAIVGQQISVVNARGVLARMALRFGARVDGAPDGLRTTFLRTTFPRAAVFAALTPAALQACGITRLRAQAIVTVAREVVAGRITPEPLAPLAETLQALQRIPGIGPWTAQYIAMRALAWPNAFPEGDAVLQRQLGLRSAAALKQHASQWEPWRAYATLHLWRQHAEART